MGNCIQTSARAFFIEPSPQANAINSSDLLSTPQALEQALRSQQGNVSALAKQLHVSRMTIYRYLKKHGLEKSQP